jgi:phosphoribosylglycinamide formyltransferase-1
VVANKDYASRAEFDAALQTVIDGFAPDLVVLAGFMRILTSRSWNITRGACSISTRRCCRCSRAGDACAGAGRRRAGTWRHGAFRNGRTRSWADGAQASVPVLPDDTVETLSARVLEQEHVIYPRAVRWFVEDRLTLAQGAVQVDHSK